MELVLFLILSIRQYNYTTFTEGLLSFILNALRAIPEKCIILSSRKNKHMVNDISCRYRIQLVVEAAAGGIVPDIAQILQEA